MTFSDQEFKVIRAATKHNGLLSPSQNKCIAQINYRLSVWQERGEFLTEYEKKVIKTLEQKLSQQIAWADKSSKSAEQLAATRRGHDDCRKLIDG